MFQTRSPIAATLAATASMRTAVFRPLEAARRVDGGGVGALGARGREDPFAQRGRRLDGRGAVCQRAGGRGQPANSAWHLRAVREVSSYTAPRAGSSASSAYPAVSSWRALSSTLLLSRVAASSSFKRDKPANMRLLIVPSGWPRLSPARTGCSPHSRRAPVPHVADRRAATAPSGRARARAGASGRVRGAVLADRGLVARERIGPAAVFSPDEIDSPAVHERRIQALARPRSGMKREAPRQIARNASCTASSASASSRSTRRARP